MYREMQNLFFFGVGDGAGNKEGSVWHLKCVPQYGHI